MEVPSGAAPLEASRGAPLEVAKCRVPPPPKYACPPPKHECRVAPWKYPCVKCRVAAPGSIGVAPPKASRVAPLGPPPKHRVGVAPGSAGCPLKHRVAPQSAGRQGRGQVASIRAWPRPLPPHLVPPSRRWPLPILAPSDSSLASPHPSPRPRPRRFDGPSPSWPLPILIRSPPPPSGAVSARWDGLWEAGPGRPWMPPGHGQGLSASVVAASPRLVSARSSLLDRSLGGRAGEAMDAQGPEGRSGCHCGRGRAGALGVDRPVGRAGEAGDGQGLSAAGGLASRWGALDVPWGGRAGPLVVTSSRSSQG